MSRSERCGLQLGMVPGRATYGRGAARHSKTGAFSAKFGPFRRGLAKGAESPWLRSLLTFCRITESKCLRGMSGLKEKDLFFPRG